MGQLFIVLAVALVAAALVFGITVLIMGGDQGLEPAEPDGRSVPLPGSRPLTESDLGELRFDVTLRGYRMTQVDQALRRAGYDFGYKEELIGVLEAEVEALRAGRVEEADALRAARENAARPAQAPDDNVDLTGESAGTDRDAAGRSGRTGDAPGVLDADRTVEPDPAADTDRAESGSTADTDRTESGLAGDADRTVDSGAAAGDATRGADVPAGDGDQESRGWPTGFGKMGDPAAVEPAK
ncbi:MAG TPA: DivIVA domain-containing protein [Rugosimonospora sp.]